MKATILIMLISLSFSAATFAQETEKKQVFPQESNLFTGGSISLGFSGGSYSTFLFGLHPHLGYKLAKWIDVAGVVNFEYQSQRDPFNEKLRNTTYGIGAFTRIYPVHFLFIQAEPEINFITQKYIPSTGGNTFKRTVNAPSLLLGGGYIPSRSDNNTFTYLSILFDVLKNENSPYVDGYGNILPVIRAGVNIGLNKRRR